MAGSQEWGPAGRLRSHSCERDTVKVVYMGYSLPAKHTVPNQNRHFLQASSPFANTGMPWHGGTATTGMSHIAIQEALDGNVVDWLEKVTDEEYLAEPTL